MILCKKPRIEIIHCDNMDYMKDILNKDFQLAMVDPPYGLGFDRESIDTRTAKRMSSKKRNMYGKSVNTSKYTTKNWDIKPTNEYWEELFRVSENQIVWGGNHFPLPISKGWVFWDKGQNEQVNFSAGELAWTSFDTKIRKFSFTWAGFDKQVRINRIHPTEKPVALYSWLIKTFAKEGDKILDTHLGSGSSAIASFKCGHDFVGIEIDEEYYTKAVKRIEKYIGAYTKPLFTVIHEKNEESEKSKDDQRGQIPYSRSRSLLHL
jgi:site-specific DNA-methyltransferase (adenine-specific)